MKTRQRISGTFVRNHWTSVASGVAEGKIYLVENHGEPEAAVVHPSLLAGKPAFDLEAYLERLNQQPATRLSEVNRSFRRNPKT